MSLEAAVNTVTTLHQSITKAIRGRDDTIKLVLTGLFADGHVLLEDYPGSGKTTLAKVLGNSIDCRESKAKEAGIVPFRRIQFTPDLLPTDVLGVNIFDPNSTTFAFRHGPIFAHILLADEINRTGPKVQAAFLECMAERQVTIDNTTHPLDDLFFVIGTQNPLDLAGTYPLPLVQLDRFLLRIPMKYVDAETELEILKDAAHIQAYVTEAKPVVTREEVLAARKATNEVKISEDLLQAVVKIVQDTRSNPALQFGASTRAALMFRRALQAWALVEGRDYVIPDDIKFLAPFVLRHRLRFHPGVGDQDNTFLEIVSPAVEKIVANEL